MKKENGYTECDSEDLDPFNKCQPVDCEEKYLGKRNFFKDSHCIPAAICEVDDDVFYDYNTNECRRIGDILSDEDLRQIKSGDFTNWVDEDEEQLLEDNFEVLKVGMIDKSWFDQRKFLYLTFRFLQW
jgi:hypothetical protein